MAPTRTIDDALQNTLLAALPSGEFEKIRPALVSVDLEAGEVLWEAETKGKYIYFPTTALILLLYESDTGVSIEVGVTGRQGMLGISTVISDAATPTRAVTYRAGQAFKMAASAVKEEFSECGDFQEICLYFTQSLINQVTQSAVCNRLHSVDQQMCRLLLKIHDHQNDEIVRLTHEQIAQALGVRRETVSIAASTLQENGLIKYSRGRIRLLDRKGLEGFACECYKTETKGYKKLIAKYAAKHS